MGGGGGGSCGALSRALSSNGGGGFDDCPIAANSNHNKFLPPKSAAEALELVREHGWISVTDIPIKFREEEPAILEAFRQRRARGRE